MSSLPVLCSAIKAFAIEPVVVGNIITVDLYLLGMSNETTVDIIAAAIVIDKIILRF
jgi:hypothetical protein